jgi:hypothetical protein
VPWQSRYAHAAGWIRLRAEGNQLSGGVENRDGHRGEVAAGSVSQRVVRDGARGPEADPVFLTERHLIHLQTESILSV